MNLENAIPQSVEEIWARIGKLSDQEARHLLGAVSPELKEAYDKYVLGRALNLLNSTVEGIDDYRKD